LILGLQTFKLSITHNSLYSMKNTKTRGTVPVKKNTGQPKGGRKPKAAAKQQTGMGDTDLNWTDWTFAQLKAQQLLQ
jgi:hypothetical protein